MAKFTNPYIGTPQAREYNAGKRAVQSQIARIGSIYALLATLYAIIGDDKAQGAAYQDGWRDECTMLIFGAQLRLAGPEMETYQTCIHCPSRDALICAAVKIDPDNIKIIATMPLAAACHCQCHYNPIRYLPIKQDHDQRFHIYDHETQDYVPDVSWPNLPAARRDANARNAAYTWR